MGQHPVESTTDLGGGYTVGDQHNRAHGCMQSRRHGIDDSFLAVTHARCDVEDALGRRLHSERLVAWGSSQAN